MMSAEYWPLTLPENLTQSIQTKRQNADVSNREFTMQNSPSHYQIITILAIGRDLAWVAESPGKKGWQGCASGNHL